MKERDVVLWGSKSEEADPSWRVRGDSPVEKTLVLRPKGRGNTCAKACRGGCASRNLEKATMPGAQ